MKIANSVFDSVHSRPAFVYNRASLELLIAVLFDQTLVVPTASIIDSPVLHAVFGALLRAQHEYGPQAEELLPLELRIDPVKHFAVSSHKHVLLEAAAAYLSGRAQTGRDLAAEHPHKYPLPHNFALISECNLEAVGRANILDSLRQNDWDILEVFSPYFQDNAAHLNRYFVRNPQMIKPVGDLFIRGTYQDYVLPRLQRYTAELDLRGLGQFTSTLSKVVEETNRSGAFTRNQLNLRGRDALGDDWAKYFVPFINHHYWDLLAKLFESNASINIEMGDTTDEDVASAIVTSIPEGSFTLGGQVSFAARDDDMFGDGYKSPDRVPIEWKNVLKLRLSKDARSFLRKIREAESRQSREKVQRKYINYISDELGPLFRCEPDEFGKFSVELGNGKRHFPPAVALYRDILPIATAAVGAFMSSDGPSGAIVAASSGWVATKLQKAIDRFSDRRAWRKLLDSQTLL